MIAIVFPQVSEHRINLFRDQVKSKVVELKAIETNNESLNKMLSHIDRLADSLDRENYNDYKDIIVKLLLKVETMEPEEDKVVVEQEIDKKIEETIKPHSVKQEEKSSWMDKEL
jgi:tRNA/tmRNA/rRNA uracil-C5-methylase (TrmA/RlmC/RlmD family)